jgi:hypothetical protein
MMDDLAATRSSLTIYIQTLFFFCLGSKEIPMHNSILNNFKCNILYVKQFFNKSSFSMKAHFNGSSFLMKAIFQ